jgi:hypothetical protein
VARVYCAPEGRPLIMAHEAEPGADLDAPLGMEPLTVCGLPMTGLWTAVENLDRVTLCPACALGEQSFEPLRLGGVA